MHLPDDCLFFIFEKFDSSVDRESFGLTCHRLLRCPLLKEWNLSLCTEIKLSGWESIGKYCHNLEKLHVNGCRGLCDRGLIALRNGCKRLSVVYITRCQQVSMLAITLFKIARWDVEMKLEEVMCIMPKHFF
ncbi:putative leucine-rich repeat domain superfamily [Helianthus annuus]|uniref:Leucine-rich repeat domain superfamily n=1 Tax=Helianthus annuus TaxID=4232 RepID=A0A9K3IVB4_HELAN|nr:putative leucine-rich repeat domain superfamily [Helianthus annuus]KAJ0915800.1 putative leucine-rich repeat domain superfamily [Helianthus annuus]